MIFCAGTARNSKIQISASGNFSRIWRAQPFLIVRLVAAAVDEPLHGVEQFQPVFQRRLLHALPDIKPLGAMEKMILAPDVLGIDLQFFAVLGDAFPTISALGMIYG